MRLLTRRLAIDVPCAAAVLALLPGLSPAAAFESDGCTLRLTALDPNRQPLGSVVAGANDATQEQPLVVSWDGSLRWDAEAGGGIGSTTEGGPASWQVEAFGVPTPLRGADAQAPLSGILAVSDLAPFRLTGLFHLSGEWTMAGSTCRGSGWIRLSGSALSSVPLSVALALLLLGTVLLATGARGAWALAVSGGGLIGAGSLVLLITYGALPFGARTPPAVILIGILLGLLVGLAAARPARSQRDAPRRVSVSNRRRWLP